MTRWPPHLTAHHAMPTRT